MFPILVIVVVVMGRFCGIVAAFIYLAERLNLRVAVNTMYLVGFRGRRRLITMCRKFAAVSHRIWQTS